MWRGRANTKAVGNGGRRMVAGSWTKPADNSGAKPNTICRAPASASNNKQNPLRVFRGRSLIPLWGQNPEPGGDGGRSITANGKDLLPPRRKETPARTKTNGPRTADNRQRPPRIRGEIERESRCRCDPRHPTAPIQISPGARFRFRLDITPCGATLSINEGQAPRPMEAMGGGGWGRCPRPRRVWRPGSSPRSLASGP